MISPDPAERLFLDKGLFIVPDGPLQGLFPHEPCALVIFPLFERHGAPVREIPWRPGSGRIIFHMPDLAASFEDQGLHSFVAKFLCCPSSAGAKGIDRKSTRLNSSHLGI